MSRHAVHTGANVLRLSVEDDGQLISYAACAVRGVLNAPNIGANQNNYAPSGLGGARIIRVKTSGGTFSITGVDIAQFPAQQRVGVWLWIYNISTNAADVINFTNEGAGSTAANRIITPTGSTFALANRARCELWYDDQDSRWRLSA